MATYYFHIYIYICGKWPYNCYFLFCCFESLFKTVSTIPAYLPSTLFILHFGHVEVVPLYNSIDTVTNWKKSHFISSERWVFHTINNLSMAVYAFARLYIGIFNRGFSYLANHPWRRTRHLGHCWSCKDDLIKEVVSSTPKQGRASVGWPARTYIHKHRASTRCRMKNLRGVRVDRDQWWKRIVEFRAVSMSWWWIYIYIYIYIVKRVKLATVVEGDQNTPFSREL